MVNIPFLNGSGTTFPSGRLGTAYLWTGSYALPDGIEIGTGSSTKTINTTGLTTPVLFRAFTQATDISTPQNVTFESDFTSTELSGLTITETAVKKSGAGYWSADGFAPITFDGSLECAVLYTWVVF